MARIAFAFRLLFAQPRLGRRERLGALIALAALVLLLLYPAGGSEYRVGQLRDALLLAIFALSLGTIGMVWIGRYREVTDSFLVH